VNQVFESCDVLLTPTLPETPRHIGVLDGRGILGVAWPSQVYIAYTAIWNVCGNPAGAVPAGFTDDGLPLSVQLVGRPNDEATLISLAAQLEAERGWADLRPPVS
jgi:amidase